MNEVGLILLLGLIGPGFVALGIRTLREGSWQNGVPAIELMIDRALGQVPPPRTAWDRRFAMFHVVMTLVLGSFFSLAFLAVVYSQFFSE